MKQDMLDALERDVPKFAMLVQPLYKQLRWTWATNGGRVPSVEEIKQCAYDLIRNMRMSPDATASSTGGLEVVRDELGVHLRFTKEVSVFEGEV